MTDDDIESVAVSTEASTPPEEARARGQEEASTPPEEAPRDEEDFLKCAVCAKEIDRYFRLNGVTLGWQVVVFNARSEFLSDNSEHGTVCRDGECANTWFVKMAPVVAEKMVTLYADKRAAEKKNAKILDGKKRGMPGGLRIPDEQ